uniref:Ig-like domain-containing protein n=1 Tax=Calidris pygmaea TaxID=425635 RepID=A0A8C3KLL0_9CHAR
QVGNTRGRCTGTLHGMLGGECTGMLHKDVAQGIGSPPQVRIVPEPLGDTDAVLLTCHVWGFYPPPVTVLWWHRGHVVATGDKAKLLPSGNWTYQTQVTLRVTPKVGDTFTCSVQHASLDQPLQEHWSELGGVCDTGR